jgi:hypothetical protein
MMTKKVNWVLDLDLRGFFDSIDHGWLIKFVEHRIADRRVVRLIQKWLNAGVLEDGKRILMETGTPQGGSASPLLANVYLHYVFDLWVQEWGRKHARGDLMVVRFADDIVLGFQYRSEAEQFFTELAARMRKFGLELHPDKTRLVEFGRFAARDRQRRGEGKPETFAFLGFTHICGKGEKSGRFMVRRQTMRQRLQAKLSEVKAQLRRRLHDPVPEVGKWLGAVVTGHNRYYGLPLNYPALFLFRSRWAGCGSARFRGAVTRATSPGTGCGGLLTAGCPRYASITPILCVVMASLPKARAGCGSSARPDPWRGPWATMVPTPTTRTLPTPPRFVRDDSQSPSSQSKKIETPATGWKACPTKPAANAERAL